MSVYDDIKESLDSSWLKPLNVRLANLADSMPHMEAVRQKFYNSDPNIIVPSDVENAYRAYINLQNYTFAEQKLLTGADKKLPVALRENDLKEARSIFDQSATSWNPDIMHSFGENLKAAQLSFAAYQRELERATEIPAKPFSESAGQFFGAGVPRGAGGVGKSPGAQAIMGGIGEVFSNAAKGAKRQWGEWTKDGNTLPWWVVGFAGGAIVAGGISKWLVDKIPFIGKGPVGQILALGITVIAAMQIGGITERAAIAANQGTGKNVPTALLEGVQQYGHDVKNAVTGPPLPQPVPGK